MCSSLLAMCGCFAPPRRHPNDRSPTDKQHHQYWALRLQVAFSSSIQYFLDLVPCKYKTHFFCLPLLHTIGNVPFVLCSTSFPILCNKSFISFHHPPQVRPKDICLRMLNPIASDKLGGFSCFSFFFFCYKKTRKLNIFFFRLERGLHSWGRHLQRCLLGRRIQCRKHRVDPLRGGRHG